MGHGKMRVSEQDIMTEEQFQAWLDELVTLHPEITDVMLVGSRALGVNRPDSDFDVIICLRDACYELIEKACVAIDGSPSTYTTARARDYGELRMALEISRPSLDIFFLWPDGTLHRYNYLELIYEELLEGKYQALMELVGHELSDEEASQLAGPILDGELEGDFTRLYKELGHAKALYPVERQDFLHGNKSGITDIRLDGKEQQNEQK